MNSEDLLVFERLKKAVATTFLTTNSASEQISDWKGEEIVAFQEELFTKVKAKVSEKWFYTYMKREAAKLPRIDMLNMLSQYVGYANWAAFRTTHKTVIQPKKIARYRYAWLLLLIPILSMIFYMQPHSNTFHFCFVDADKNEGITKIPIDIKVLKENESPLYFKTDSTGCFSYQTNSDFMRFVVQSPYHKTDTILRYFDSSQNTMIHLETDDYALMLHYYSTGNVVNWKKRKQQLDALIADDALIYQMFDQQMGVELYSKEDFIRMLTIPTSSLQRIRILDKSYKDGKLVKLKFLVQ